MQGIVRLRIVYFWQVDMQKEAVQVQRQLIYYTSTLEGLRNKPVASPILCMVGI